MNLFQEKPLIRGGESYYHLLQSRERIYAFPLLLEGWLGEEIVLLLPLLGALSAWLFLKLGLRFGLAPGFLTLFAALFFFSPPFLYAFSLLSFYGYYFLLLLLGFLLLSSPGKYRYLAVVPFLWASLYDVAQALAAAVLIGLYCYKNPPLRKFGWFLGLLAVASALAGVLLGQVQILAGPFQEQEVLGDLVSDIGLAPGLSLFLLLLAILGIILSWTKKLVLPNILLGIALVMYVLRTESLFLMALILTSFAALAWQHLAQRQWQLPTLKQFTLLLLALGLLFSLLSRLERQAEPGPTAADLEASNWIRVNFPTGIIFSPLEKAYFLQYATGLPVQEYYHQQGNLTPAILSQEDVKDLFPLLENNNITIIYVSAPMREKLPSDQGFLFLLKNERFKLVHSNEEAEVWVFHGN